MSHSKFKVLILGGGAGGVSVAAKLVNKLGQGQIAIIDPSDRHYYQPLWTVVGAGLASIDETVKNQKDVIPEGVSWIKEKVISVDPTHKKVLLSDQSMVEFEFLIVATGLQLDWDKIKGAKEALGSDGVCSVYQFNQVEYAAELIQNFKGGRAIFVMPQTPIKCAGAPQKVMYLAENIFRNHGVRHKSEIMFMTAGKAMFGIPVFSNQLDQIVKERDIHPKFQHKLIEIKKESKEALFEVVRPNGEVAVESYNYDLLHVVPTMSAHNFITQSGLAVTEGEQKGWLAVDKFTLQHLNYPYIFGIGDVTGVPNSKTGAAVRAQYPIVAANLLSVMNGKQPTMKYNGYSSCPLITEIGKVMLAEFGYEGKLLPTFPLDPAVPRTSYWYLKRYLLSKLYWYGMLKGIA